MYPRFDGNSFGTHRNHTMFLLNGNILFFLYHVKYVIFFSDDRRYFSPFAVLSEAINILLISSAKERGLSKS